MKKKILKMAFVDSVPVMTGYIVLGIGFGILSAKNGYGPWWALAMSIFIYAGSMQYLTVSLLSGGASLVAAALSTLAVNARHIFYGISMIEKYEGSKKKKPYLIFALTDETYSLVVSRDDLKKEDYHNYCLAVSFMDQCYWITGSLLGALLGTMLEFNSTGIDFSMTALFVTVFTDQWLNTENHVSALIGVGASLACLIVARCFFNTTSFLIPAMLLITVLLTVFRDAAETEVDSHE